jgi:hypothetical protein
MYLYVTEIYFCTHTWLYVTFIYFNLRGSLEHGNFVGIPKDRICVGNFSFVQFGTQEREKEFHRNSFLRFMFYRKENIQFNLLEIFLWRNALVHALPLLSLARSLVITAGPANDDGDNNFARDSTG